MRSYFILLTYFGLYLPSNGFFLAFSSFADESAPPLESDLLCLTDITYKLVRRSVLDVREPPGNLN